jgi:O-antigen/teichoic acid export membrane protein
MTFGLSGMLGQLISFFLLPVYTKYLSPTDYGIVAMLFIITASFQTIASLGINESIFKYFRDSEIDKVELHITAFLTILTSASVTFIFGILISDILIEKLFESSIVGGRRLIILSLVYAFFVSLSSVFNTIIRAKRQVKHAFLVNMIFLLTQVIISLFLIVIYNYGVLGLITGQMVGQIFVFCALIFLTKDTFRLRPNFLLFKKMIAYGIYSVPAQILETLMNQMGQFMIKTNLSLKESGLYGIGERITLPIQVIGGSMRYAHSAFFFQILNEDENPKILLRALASFYIILLTYLWVGVSIYGVEVLRFLTPIEYHTARDIIGPIALIPVLLIVYTFVASGIDSGTDLKPYIIVNVVGFIIFFLSLSFFLTRMGLIGAAYASIFARLGMIIISNYFSQKRLKINYNIKLAVLLIIFGSISIFINKQYYFEEFRIRLIVLLLTTIIFPVISFLLLIIFPIERIQAINFFKSIFFKTLTK